MTDCKAGRERDGTVYCGRCGFAWDKDEEPPKCLTSEQIGARYLSELKALTARWGPVPDSIAPVEPTPPVPEAPKK